MTEHEPIPLPIEYLNKVIDERAEQSAELAMTDSALGKLTENAIYYYELSEHPEPWSSKDDEDLLQHKDG